MEDNKEITSNEITNSNAVVEANELQQTSLLEGLEKLQKKHLFYQRVSCLFIVILVVSVLSVIPGLVRTLNMAQETMNNANEAILNANEMILVAKGTLNDISSMVVNSEKDINEAMVGINEAMLGLTSIDFDGLNNAIADLEAVVEPLANFFSKFSR